MRVIAVTRHALLELLVWEMGDQFREDEPAIVHPRLLRIVARTKKAVNSAVRNSNRSRLKVPLGNCRARAYPLSQSTLPDTSDFTKTGHATLLRSLEHRAATLGFYTPDSAWSVPQDDPL